MVIYGLIVAVLADQIQGEYPGLLQPSCVDNFGTGGAGNHIKPDIVRVEALGPARGFFLEPDKSQFVRAQGGLIADGKGSQNPTRVQPRGGGAADRGGCGV